MPKVIPEISIESQEVLRRLEGAKVGDVVDYAELSKIAGGDIQGESRHALVTARKHERNAGRIWETITKQGVKLLSDAEVVRTSGATIERTHRAADRAAKRLITVEYDVLEGAEKVRHNTHLTLYALLGHITRPRKVKLLEDRIAKTNQRLQLQETLEALKAKDDE